MRRALAALCALILLCAYAACSPAQQESAPATALPSASPPPETTSFPVESATPQPPDVADAGYFGALQVRGASLTDADGNAVQLRGVSSHGLSWFPEYVNGAMLRQLREAFGCNVFRLAMYTEEYNGYCAGDEANRERLQTLIDDAVSLAGELSMYIIIDWHILSDGNPLTHENDAREFFSWASERFASMEHVIFELCNEPNGDVSWQDVKAYAEAVIPVIREHSDAVILIGTPTWSQDIHLAADEPVTGYENLMYTLHFYAATHKDELRERLTEAVQSGLPVFVSEYGICDASGSGEVDEAEADLWIETLDGLGVSHVMWNLSNKDESSAMLIPSCQRTSGVVYEDLSRSGRWFAGMMGAEIENALPDT